MTVTVTVTVKVDHENNAVTWWEAFRHHLPALCTSDPEVYELCQQLDQREEVEIADPWAMERFDAFVTGLPGWETGPAHARTPLLFHAN